MVARSATIVALRATMIVTLRVTMIVTDAPANYKTSPSYKVTSPKVMLEGDLTLSSKGKQLFPKFCFAKPSGKDG